MKRAYYFFLSSRLDDARAMIKYDGARDDIIRYDEKLDKFDCGADGTNRPRFHVVDSSPLSLASKRSRRLTHLDVIKSRGKRCGRVIRAVPLRQ